MSNPTPNFIPPDPDVEPEDDLATREVDGTTEIDPDADPDLIESAEADRLAAGGDEE